MRGAIDLEHHPFTGPSFSAASVFIPRRFLGDASHAQEYGEPFHTELDLFCP